MDSRKRWLVACVAGLSMIVVAAPAQAAKDAYPSNQDARTFDVGLAGYTSSARSEGLCVPLLLCPVIANSHQPSGGVNGTGYISTRLGSLTGVGATSIGVFESPTFTYEGVGGNPADTLRVRIARRSDVAALLQAAGNSATYSVDVVSATGGSSVSAISGESLAGLSDFAEKSVEIDPSSLKLGSEYLIRITSRFTSGVQVLPGGSADYDNVRVQAKAKLGGGGNGNGGNGNGGNGTNGGNGSNGNSGSNGNGDRFQGNGAVSGAAKLRGDRLIVKVRCKGKPHGRCLVNLQAKLRKRGPAVSNRRTARVRAGHKRRISLNVRSRYLGKLEKRAAKGKKIVLRQKVRKSGKTTKGYVKVRVKLA